MQVGPNVRARPNGMYGMWYLGELTKLYAYGFQFMFKVFPVPQGRASDDCRVHHLVPLFMIDSEGRVQLIHGGEGDCINDAFGIMILLN